MHDWHTGAWTVLRKTSGEVPRLGTQMKDFWRPTKSRMVLMETIVVLFDSNIGDVQVLRYAFRIC